MKAKPSFQFYPSDWLRDPGLRCCSLAARGLWIDLLAFMHEGEPYGHLRLNGKAQTIQEISRMVGSSPGRVKRLLLELGNSGVFSRTQEGTIFSRRMVRDQQLRIERGQFGHLSSNNPAVPRKKESLYQPKDSPKDTFYPSIDKSPSYSSSSSSSTKNKNSSLNSNRDGRHPKECGYVEMPQAIREMLRLSEVEPLIHNQ